MAKVLQLYNTFTRKLNQVKLNGQFVTSIGGQDQSNHVSPRRNHLVTGSFYICGPTVYSDSHLGHALTYIRADLFRRFIKSYFNVHLTTVMNITDIDDKILQRCREEFTDHANYSTDPRYHPFRKIGDRYYKSFFEDMTSIRVKPADVYVNISDNINIIINYIRKLEQNGQAYLSSNGDLLFNVKSVENYVGRVDKRMDNSNDGTSKMDSRDFVLWKGAKELEPVWNYRSVQDDRIIRGRPGWHVQCSAISSAFFGSRLDFHYGGKDLIFPHHYNEEACSCAFHQLDTKSSMHVWCSNWLHSSHLKIRQDASNSAHDKMSKSLGNVVPIRNFIDKNSVNALRLLCVLSHYRSDLDYSEELIEAVKTLDHKLNALHNFLEDKINQSKVISDVNICPDDNSDSFMMTNSDLELMLFKTSDDIVEGICDDLDLKKGLDSILNLAKFLYSKEATEFKSKDLIACRSLLRDWCLACGLKYGLMDSNWDPGQSSLENSTQGSLQELIRNFRHQVRSLALKEIKSSTQQKQQQTSGAELARKLLIECDKVRANLNDLGLVERDPGSKD